MPFILRFKFWIGQKDVFHAALEIYAFENTAGKLEIRNSEAGIGQK